MTANDIIARALRLLGVIASGESPSSSEAANALVSINAVQTDLLDAFAPLNDLNVTGGVDLNCYLDGNYRLIGATSVTDQRDPCEGFRLAFPDACTHPNGTGGDWFYSEDWAEIADLGLTDEPIFAARFHDGLSAILAMRLADEYGAALKPATLELARVTRRRLRQRYLRPVRQSAPGVLCMSVQAL